MPKPSRSNRKRSAGRRPADSRTAKPHNWERTVDWIVVAGLVLLVAVGYVQVVHFDFVNYDDTVYVPDNLQVRTGFSLSGIRWAFTTFETANWYPLTWLSLMLDCQMFGPRPASGYSSPGGHHAVNAALHAANAVLLFLVLRRMTGSRWRSAAVAALFAVHPLHVESVAWIAERKDVLSTLFFLLTLLAYHRYAASPRFGRWVLVFLCMALGLMAKSMLVTLPAVLLLLDFWPLKRFRGLGGIAGILKPTQVLAEIGDRESAIGSPPSTARLLLEKLPLLALSLATAAVTVAAQASKGATSMLDDRAGLPVRLANAAIASVKYLVLTVWPANLAVYYPYNFHPSTWQTAGAVLLLLAATAGAGWCLRRAPCVAVGWFWYLGTLVPVIGLVQVGSQAMADRYCYIPSIGIYLVVVWVVGDLTSWLLLVAENRKRRAVCHPKMSSPPSENAYRSPDIARNAAGWQSAPQQREVKRRIALAAVSSAILAVFLVAMHRQAGYWINSEQLFRHALAITGENPVACENLGDSLLHQGKFTEAESQFRKVLAMDAAHFRQTPPELARALAGQGRIDAAIAFVHETIPDKSEKAVALISLANFLGPPPRNQVGTAIKLLQEAIELAPQQPMGPNSLAQVYLKAADRRFRNATEAIKLARRACELSEWNNAQCRQTLADAYLAAGDTERAVEELRSVIRLTPTDSAAAKQLQSILRQRR